MQKIAKITDTCGSSWQALNKLNQEPVDHTTVGPFDTTDSAQLELQTTHHSGHTAWNHNISKFQLQIANSLDHIRSEAGES